MVFNQQDGYYRYRRYFTDLGRFYQGRKARTFAGLILSILTTTFFLVFAIKPTLITIAGLMKQIDDQQLTSEKLQNKINALGQAQQEYNLIKNDLSLIDQALPQHPEIALFVKQLEALARQSGVTIETIKLGEANITRNQKTEGNQSVHLSFTVSAGYQRLKQFLQSLSSLRRIVLIESFSFKTSEAKTETQALTLSLEAETYYLKDSKNEN